MSMVTVDLKPDLKSRAETEAKRLGMSLADLMRMSLVKELDANKAPFADKIEMGQS